jgi:hypothetical protein
MLQEEAERIGRLIVDGLESDQEFMSKLCDAAPQIPRVLWRDLERVGRGSLDKRLIFESGSLFRSVKRLPVGQQKDILDNGVKVLTESGDHLLVKVEDIPRSQIQQVFGYDHIRPLREQKAWIEAKKMTAAEAPLPAASPYEIHKGKVVVVRPVVLTTEELIKLAQQTME